jgi:hypothetical protein
MTELYTLANHLREFPEVPPAEPILKRSEGALYKNRMVLVEKEGGEAEDKFTMKYYLPGKIVSYNGLRGKFKVQTLNKSGEPDGEAMYEASDDLWLLPQVGEVVELVASADKFVVVKAYVLATMSVTLTKATQAQTRDFEAKAKANEKTTANKKPDDTKKKAKEKATANKKTDGSKKNANATANKKDGNTKKKATANKKDGNPPKKAIANKKDGNPKRKTTANNKKDGNRKKKATANKKDGNRKKKATANKKDGNRKKKATANKKDGNPKRKATANKKDDNPKKKAIANKKDGNPKKKAINPLKLSPAKFEQYLRDLDKQFNEQEKRRRPKNLAGAISCRRPRKKVKRERKTLDKPSTSSGSNPETGGANRFSHDALMRSFRNPRCTLFLESVKAEIKHLPHLQHLTPKEADRDPPDILFGGQRRKGYFKCPALCRVFVLQILRELRERGEFFVLWNDPVTGGSYDGLAVLAHAFVIKYVAQHKPAMTIHFRADGSIRATSVHVKKLRRWNIHI